MAKKYEVTAIIGKYTDKNGDEKNRYLTIGAIINTRDEQPARAAKQAPKAGFEDMADDIPF